MHISLLSSCLSCGLREDSCGLEEEGQEGQKGFGGEEHLEFQCKKIICLSRHLM